MQFQKKKIIFTMHLIFVWTFQNGCTKNCCFKSACIHLPIFFKAQNHFTYEIVIFLLCGFVRMSSVIKSQSEQLYFIFWISRNYIMRKLNRLNRTGKYTCTCIYNITWVRLSTRFAVTAFVLSIPIFTKFMQKWITFISCLYKIIFFN